MQYDTISDGYTYNDVKIDYQTYFLNEESPNPPKCTIASWWGDVVNTSYVYGIYAISHQVDV